MCVTSAMLSLYKYRGHDSHGDTIRNNMDHLNRDLGESEHGCGRTARDCTHAHARSRGALQRRHARCRRLANPRGAIQPRLFVSFLAFVFCRASGLRRAGATAPGENSGRPGRAQKWVNILPPRHDEPDTTPHTRRGNPRNRQAVSWGRGARRESHRSNDTDCQKGSPPNLESSRPMVWRRSTPSRSLTLAHRPLLLCAGLESLVRCQSHS